MLLWWAEGQCGYIDTSQHDGLYNGKRRTMLIITKVLVVINVADLRRINFVGKSKDKVHPCLNPTYRFIKFSE